MQLFCLSYAGGTSGFYDPIISRLGDLIEIVPLEYAGHGSRHASPFYTDFDELAEDMYAQLTQLWKPGKAYALIGYSMGAIAQYEVTLRILRKRELPLPVCVFIAAHTPAPIFNIDDYKDEELSDFVISRTVRFGGVPEKLVNNKTFWRTYLPLYLTDYRLIGKYDFRRMNTQLDVPATVFYSETDTPLRSMKNWSRIYRDVEYRQYEGSHFFIRQHYDSICGDIVERLLTRECISGKTY